MTRILIADDHELVRETIAAYLLSAAQMEVAQCADLDSALEMIEVVLLFRPECSPVKVDQGFTSGCHFHGFRFADMDLFGGQYAMGRVGPLGVVIGQPFPNTVSGL